MRFPLLSILLVTSVGWTTTGRANPPQSVTDRPQGEYRLAELTVTDGDSIPRCIVLGFRDERAVSVAAGFRNPFVTAEITLRDGRLRGVIEDRHPVFDPAGEVHLKLDAMVNDHEEITGTVTGRINRDQWNFKSGKLPQPGRFEDVSGTVTGRLRTTKELVRRNHIVDGVTWPAWRGPTGDRVASQTDTNLVRDLNQARLAWRSEAVTPSAPGSSKDIPRTMKEAPFLPTNGGGASPIVADNRVFLRYHRPSGERFDEQLYRRYVDWELPETALERGRDLLKIAADDIVLCLDARTGETLWETALPDAGLNIQGHKTAQNNLTPVYHAGRVYAVGSTLRLHCVDAATGEWVWSVPLGPATERHEQLKSEGLATGQTASSRVGNRNYGFAPIAIGELIISNDGTGKMVAFDAATGELRWRTETGTDGNRSPHHWRFGNEDYVIYAERERLVCVTAATGETVWTQPARVMRSPVVTDGLIAWHDLIGPPGKTVPPGTKLAESDGELVVCRLLPSGPDFLWSKTWGTHGTGGEPIKHHYSPYCTPLIEGGRLFLSGRLGTDVFDATTGRPVGSSDGAGGVANAGHLFFGNGRLFACRDGKHGVSDFVMYTSGDDKFRKLGDADSLWTPPHPTTTSYGPYLFFPLVDGRLFVRGSNGIFCYDLRDR